MVQVVENQHNNSKLALSNCYVQLQKAYMQLSPSIADQYIGTDFAILVECTQL